MTQLCETDDCPHRALGNGFRPHLCADCDDLANEAAYERHQAMLMENGGRDDSGYRRDMIAAGRGHLLK